MPKGLELWKPAYGTVAFQGVPMFRCQAWALFDYVQHGGHLIVNSADRRKGVAERFGKLSQFALFEGFRLGKPGFFPANPSGFSSHELRSDGNVFYGPRGSAIPKYMLGIDAVDKPGGDALAVVKWLNRHGYEATRPYGNKASERHHFSFVKSPATNARKRLLRWRNAG